VSTEIFEDLEAEEDRIEEMLAGLSTGQWLAESGAPGWSVADTVLHLAQSEEAVVSTATQAGGPIWRQYAERLDDAMDLMVRAQRGTPEETFQRWRTARRAALAALRAADPRVSLPWAAAALKPRTLATTRLAEHWAHALDVTVPLGIEYPDTDRLRHIAWLGHSTLPYAFAFAGEPAGPVRCELTAPDGDVWRYGPAGAESVVSGAAGAFCRVGARRLAPEASGLVATGPFGPAALRVLRNYAG
jgi:uncharacterized protein (TIGR03084 family)